MELQKELIKWLIENPKWITKTHPELFTRWETESKIFMTAKRVVEAGRPVSIPSLKYTLRKHKDLVESLDLLENVTSPDDATALQIREDLRAEAFQHIVRRGQNVDMDDPKIRKQYLNQLHDLLLEDKPETLTRISSFSDWHRHIEIEGDTIESGLPFLLNTGTDFRRGQLINLLAPSGEFKTGTLTHITRHLIYQGKNVLFFEMEGTDQENFNRVGHGLLNMTPHQYSQLTPEQLAQRFETFNLGHLETAYGRALYVEELEDIILELEAKRGYKYDVVIIDYSAQVKLKKTKKNSQEYQDDEEIFRQLKLLAISQEKVIISAVQSNRSGYNRKRKLSRENAAASMGSVHASDLMIAVRYAPNPNRPQRDTPAEEEPDDVKGFVKMEIIKKRKGTIAVGDKFLFGHKADGNISPEWVDWHDQTEAELWDGIFEIEEDN